MQVKFESDSKVILGGVAGTLRWMIALIVIGGGVTVASVAFARALWREEGAGMYLLPLGVGVLIGVALLVVGAVQLFARERLVLDRVAGMGAYESNSPIVTTEKPFKFKFENVSAVVITTETVDPNHPSADPGIIEAKICKAILRVNRPRRAVTLDEPQNGRVGRVTAIADQVAEFLGIDVGEE
jgi:hypothetical protein